MTGSKRNYTDEFWAFVDRQKPAPRRLADLAARIVRDLEAQDPDLLRGWLRVQALGVVHDALADRARRARLAARSGTREERVLHQPGDGKPASGDAVHPATKAVPFPEATADDILAMRNLTGRSRAFQDALRRKMAERQAQDERASKPPPAGDDSDDLGR